MLMHVFELCGMYQCVVLRRFRSSRFVGQNRNPWRKFVCVSNQRLTGFGRGSTRCPVPMQPAVPAVPAMPAEPAVPVLPPVARVGDAPCAPRPGQPAPGRAGPRRASSPSSPSSNTALGHACAVLPLNAQTACAAARWFAFAACPLLSARGLHVYYRYAWQTNVGFSCSLSAPDSLRAGFGRLVVRGAGRAPTARVAQPGRDLDQCAPEPRDSFFRLLLQLVNVVLLHARARRRLHPAPACHVVG